MRESELFRKGFYGLIALLVAGNIFFIKRLVDKLDGLEAIVYQMRQEVVVLRTEWDFRKNNRGK